ncbi:DUF3392 domain-containing protein [Maribrevibacterium harenarium]|uniref:DUF3392 domain-containing protein n=1 Tax=Maribrevibacterium harenarium TaxID=2589817 RepID=A0A501WR91_9GAMM|nr:DUF3392 family protein [Maribrevibacterium harenarium]TPE50865.1 DUF3392 domain-containing protein [Maribrevibacterium harenarium]
MNVLLEINAAAAQVLHPYLRDIALALVATILVIYGNWVNGVLKRAVSGWVFIARVGAFILMCTFGYGLITFWTQPLVYWLLQQVPYLYRPIAVAIAFSFLGVLAERKRHL